MIFTVVDMDRMAPEPDVDPFQSCAAPFPVSVKEKREPARSVMIRAAGHDSCEEDQKGVNDLQTASFHAGGLRP